MKKHFLNILKKSQQSYLIIEKTLNENRITL